MLKLNNLNYFKKISSIVLTSLLLLSSSLPVSATVNSVPMDKRYYENVSKSVDGNITSYSYKIKNEKDITQIFQDEINNQRNSLRSPASGSIELEFLGTGDVSTGSQKWANQVGVSFQSGGYIYYKDGKDISIPLSVSIGGDTVGFSVGIGSISVSSSNTYGVLIPGGGTRYYGYVNKAYTVYSYKQWLVNPNGGKTEFGFTSRQVLNGIDTSYNSY